MIASGLIAACWGCLLIAAPEGGAPVADARPTPAADEPNASQLFQQGRYPEAAAAFEREYAANPDPALLFGRAVALQRSGDCFAAIEAFERFIAAGPPEPDVEEGNRQIEQCRRIIEANAARSEPTKAEPAIAPPPPAPDDEGEPERWHRDRLGATLVGVGAPLVVTGAALYGAAFGVAGRDQPGQQSDHEARRGATTAMAVAGLSVLGVGSAMVIAGAVRWGLVARGGKAGGSRRAALLRGGPVVRF